MKAQDREMLCAALGDGVSTIATEQDVEDLGGLFHARGGGEDYLTIYQHTAAHNIHRLSAVAQLCRALADVGAEPLVMPGAALLRLYPDVACRSMGDVDLLAPPGRRDLVVEALLARGWHQPPRHPDLFSRHDDCDIDLHTDLLNCDRLPLRQRAGWIDPRSAWTRRRRQEIAGFSFLTLGPEEEILLTAAHALRHSYRRLIWLVDFVLQLQQEDVDPQALATQARATGLEPPLSYAMTLVTDAQLQLPSWAQRWCIQHEPGTLVKSALARIHRNRLHTVGGELLSCWTCRRWRDRLRLLAQFVFPRRDVLLQVYPRLPSSMAPLAYPLRLLQIVGRGLSELALVLRRR